MAKEKSWGEIVMIKVRGSSALAPRPTICGCKPCWQFFLVNVWPTMQWKEWVHKCLNDTAYGKMVVLGFAIQSGEVQPSWQSHRVSPFETVFGRVRRSRLLATYNDLLALTGRSYLGNKDIAHRPYLMLPDERANPPRPLIKHYLFEDSSSPWRIFDECEDFGATKVHNALEPDKQVMESRAQDLMDFYR